MKEENYFLKNKNDHLTLKNTLGLEALTPRPDYHTMIVDKKMNQVDESIGDFIKKPNITSTNVVECLMDKLIELKNKELDYIDDDNYSNQHRNSAQGKLSMVQGGKTPLQNGKFQLIEKSVFASEIYFLYFF